MGNKFRLNGIEDDIPWITATPVEEVLKRRMCQELQRQRKSPLASGSSKAKGNGFTKSCVGLLRIMECVCRRPSAGGHSGQVYAHVLTSSV
jgi:hypothetical protein